MVGIFVGCVILVVVVVILFDVFLVCWFYVIVFWMFEVYVLYIVFRCYSYVWKKGIKLCIYNLEFVVLLIGGCKLWGFIDFFINSYIMNFIIFYFIKLFKKNFRVIDFINRKIISRKVLFYF